MISKELAIAIEGFILQELRDPTISAEKIAAIAALVDVLKR